MRAWSGRPLGMGVILTFALGTSLPVAAATAAPTFRDVPPAYWAYADIESLAAAGVINGVGGGCFDPQGLVTRAQFATMLARLDHPPADTVGPRFSDVPPTAWFYGPVEAATGLGWMSGVGGGLFDPNAPVTRAQAALTLADYLGLDHVAQDEGSAPLPFTDAAAVPAADHGAVAVAVHLGLLQGAYGQVLPAAPLTRAQAAALLVRLEGVTSRQLRREGARVAQAVHIDSATDAVDVGRPLTLDAYAFDAPGHIVPSGFSWQAQGAQLTQGASSASATLVGDVPGIVTVSVAAVGGTASATRTFTITQPTGLQAVVPPVALAGTALPISVEAVGSDGQPDPGSSGRTVTVTATPAQGPTVLARAELVQGQGTVALPSLSAGTYTVAVSGLGLPVLVSSLSVVTAPIGSVVLAPQGGGPLTLTVGQEMTVDAHIVPPAGGAGARWPVQAAVSGRQNALPHVVGEGLPPEVLSLASASSQLPAGGGSVAVLQGEAAGQGVLEVSVPGGALLPASIPIRVEPTGAFGAAQGATGTAGDAVTVDIALPQTANPQVPVYLEAIDPNGHPHPWVQAQVGQDGAQATFVPKVAGLWTLRWFRHGYLPVAEGAVQVAPGPVTHLMVDPTPTSVLLPGQRVTLRAWLADQFDNPVGQDFALQVQVQGAAAAGTLQFSPGMFSGPGAVGTFTAGTSGTQVLTFTSPDHPRLGSATVVLRTVANRVARVAGKGGWLIFPDWKAEGDAQILAQAKALGLTHLYLEVATSSDGFYGGRALDSFLPKAHAAGIAVIAWVYAALENPARDTTLLNEVAAYTTPQGDRADGVALDLEQVLTPSVVAAYTAQANADEGPDGLVVLVPFPPLYGPQAPLSLIARNIQVVAPMDYWHIYEQDYSYSEVYNWVAESVKLIHQRAGASMAVEVIAQTFDAFAGGVGKGIFSPTAAEVAAAMRASSSAGAIGVSFYRPITATSPELGVMASRPWPDG